jgi:hypothetical protein
MDLYGSRAFFSLFKTRNVWVCKQLHMKAIRMCVLTDSYIYICVCVCVCVCVTV